MPSLSAKDRVSLCQFTFSDGRRCRSHRFGNHARFCPDHAQKEARARARQSLGKDLAFYFSGDYLSACNLSTALGCLIPAVIRGDIKPSVARTVAYLAQTLMQSIRIAEHEYTNAFDTNDWRKSIRNSVNANHNYRFPSDRSGGVQAGPVPQPQPPTRVQRPVTAQSPDPTPHVVAGLQTGERRSPHAVAGLQVGEEQATKPAPPPHIPLPPTSAEFAQQVLAGLSRSVPPGSTGKTGKTQAPQPAPAPSPTSARAPQTPAFQPTQPAAPSAPPVQSTPPSTPTPPPACPELRRAGSDQAQTVTPTPPRRPNQPNRDAPWWDSRHLYDPPDSHLL